MDTRKAIIYPYTIEDTFLLRYNLFHYGQIQPVSLAEDRYNGLDAGVIDYGETLGIKISDDFDSCIDEANDVIVTKLDNRILERVITAINKGKNIISLQYSDEFSLLIQSACEKRGVDYRDLCHVSNPNLLLKDMIIATFDTPIVLVCGMSEMTQKSEILLSVHSELSEKGYKVSTIGSKPYEINPSIHGFPMYMLKKNDEYSKIVYFNNYIKSIEIKDRPDVILISVPGGVVPYDTKHNNNYGVLAYLVSQAIGNVDYAIFTMAYNNYDKDFFDFIYPYVKYRYGFDIDMFHLSNYFHDLNIDGSDDVILMNKKRVVSKVNELQQLNDIKLYSVFENKGYVVDDILCKLGD